MNRYVYFTKYFVYRIFLSYISSHSLISYILIEFRKMGWASAKNCFLINLDNLLPFLHNYFLMFKKFRWNKLLLLYVLYYYFYIIIFKVLVYSYMLFVCLKYSLLYLKYILYLLL